MPNDISLRKIGFLFVIVATLNLFASIMMLLFLGPATIAEPNELYRLQYIFDNRNIVQISWFSWILASLSLALFFYLFAYGIRTDFKYFRRYAYFLVLTGLVPDLLADLVSITVIPDIVTRYFESNDESIRNILLDQYRTWNHFAVVCTGGLGNFCYGLGGLCLTFVLFKVKLFHWLMALFSTIIWISTFMMSLSSFMLTSVVLPFVVGLTMSLFIVWVTLLGIILINKNQP